VFCVEKNVVIRSFFLVTTVEKFDLKDHGFAAKYPIGLTNDALQWLIFFQCTSEAMLIQDSYVIATDAASEIDVSVAIMKHRRLLMVREFDAMMQANLVEKQLQFHSVAMSRSCFILLVKYLPSHFIQKII
jgi:hypothetical protein